MPPAKILFILPRLANPVILIRIDMLRRAGWEVEVMAFQRDIPTERLPDWPITILGRIQDEFYLRRLPTLLFVAPKIRAAMRRSQLVYAYGLDLALVALIAGLGLAKPVVINVLDVRGAQTAPGLRGWLLRTIDRIVVARTRLLILSSTEYHHYFRDWLKIRTPSLVIENKIETSRAAARPNQVSQTEEETPLLSRPLVIGWFASLRDPWSVEFLKCLIRLAPGKFKILLAGDVSPKLTDFACFLERNPDVQYRGIFHYPDDMPGLYRNVDMMLTCYPPVIPESWSRSCRYYESCFFQKPVIVRAGTGDAVEVAKHRIGVVLGESSPEAAAREFSAITAADWLCWQASMAALPPHNYMFTDEVCGLSDVLKDILK